MVDTPINEASARSSSPPSEDEGNEPSGVSDTMFRVVICLAYRLRHRRHLP